MLAADSLVQKVWQRERRYAAVFLQGEGRCRPETRAAGTAVDLLLRAARREDSGRSAAQGGREVCQMCSLQLSGAEALLSAANQFLRGDFARSPPTSLHCREDFFFFFKLIVYVSQRLSLPGL